jgi:hypothetical protein
MERLDKFYRPAGEKTDGWYRCQRKTDDGKTCGRKLYFSLRNKDNLKKHEQEHGWDGGGASPRQQTTANDQSDSGANTPAPPATDSSEDSESGTVEVVSDNDWSSIPDGNRLEGNIVVRVTRVRELDDGPKSHLLDIVDCTGQETKLSVWETHDLDIEWREGDWYSLTEAIGDVWESKSGETVRRLSSTKDLEAESLGSDVSVVSQNQGTRVGEDVARQRSSDYTADVTTSKAEAASDTEDTFASTSQSGEPTTSAAGEAEQNEANGVLEDIMSDFEGV